MGGLGPYEGIQWGTGIEEDHVEDAILTVLQEDEVTRVYRLGDVGDSAVEGHPTCDHC